MVKQYFFLASFLVLIACTNRQEPLEKNGFDTQRFQLTNYTERIQTFLHSRPETNQISHYQALFATTEDCSACTRGTFEQLLPFLEHTQLTTFIYINDSSLRQPFQNPRIQFVQLPQQVFTDQGLFHGSIYLYTVYRDSISSTGIFLKQIDSLNRINTFKN